MSQPTTTPYQPAVGDNGWFICRGVSNSRFRAEVSKIIGELTVDLQCVDGVPCFSVFVRPLGSNVGGLGGRWFEPDAMFGPDGAGDHALPPPQVAPRPPRARVTYSQLEDEIASEYSFTADKALAGCPVVEGLDRITICILVTRNGTKLVGVNHGAINPAEHDPERGRREARRVAMEQLWPLLGYELRTRLAALEPKP